MKDLLVDDTGELIIENGDFKVGYSDNQHRQHLLLFEKGSLKEFMTGCVGSFRFLEGENPAEFLRQINLQFTGDGMIIDELRILSDEELFINAHYK